MEKTNETTAAIETVVAEPVVAESAEQKPVVEQQQTDDTPPAEAKPKARPATTKATKKRATKAKPKQAKAATAKTSGSKTTRKPALPSRSATLDDVASAYIAQLENDGASTSTISGYTAELKRALKVLGGSTLAGELTEDAVKKFMRSKHVTMKRDGEKRDQKTIDRTRRVLRLALTFAAERGIIETAPIPEKV